MSYLIIQDVKEINIPNIYLIHEDRIVKIKYKLDKNIYTIGLSFKIGWTLLKKKNNAYLIQIQNKQSLSRIREIDTYLKKNINDFPTIIDGDNIILQSNAVIDDIYSKNKGKSINISLFIKYIKKDDINYPIIHIVNE